MLQISHTTTRTLAAIIWYSGFLILTIKSTGLYYEAWEKGSSGSLVAAAIFFAALFGAVKGRYLFSRICRANLDRINGLSHPLFWQCYRLRFYLFLALMITMSKIFYQVAAESSVRLTLLATVELSVGVALLTSSTCFWVGKSQK